MIQTPTPKETLEQAKQEIALGNNIAFYKHHHDPEIRALVAGSDHAVIAYICDPAPEVRMALIRAGKWIDRIAPVEKNPKLILEMIERGIVHKNFRRLNLSVINKILDEKGLLTDL